MSLNTGASPLGSEIVSSTVNGKPPGGISHPCGSNSSQTFLPMVRTNTLTALHLSPFSTGSDGGRMREPGASLM
jgi:hypothetical protein